jgi:GTPase Era involved in 16S rRNA processing
MRAPGAAQHQRQHSRPGEHAAAVHSYRVALLGVPGVGKNALVNQFMTSECINVYERSQSGRHHLRL